MNHVDRLREVVAASALHSASRFTWFGMTSPDVQEHVRPIFQIRPDAARRYLLDTLGNRLYEDFYLSGRAVPTRSPSAGSTPANGLQSFVDELSAANSGTGTRQPGWLITGVGDGDSQISIRRDDLTLVATSRDIIWTGDRLPGIGDTVDLRLPEHLPALSPGFYTSIGNSPYEPRQRQVVRLYWNLYAWCASTFTQTIVEQLNAAGLPFRLKQINHPDSYNRCDAAVLYLLKDDLTEAIPLLSSAYREVQADMKQPVPAFTRRIAAGVGLAEDPPGGDSFGRHRCLLLAEGLVRGWERGATSHLQRLAVVIETLREAGVDPEHPYRNPGPPSDDDSTFAAAADAISGLEIPAGSGRSPATDRLGDRSFLDVASAIGSRICEEAFWHQGQCNWLGADAHDPHSPGHHHLTYRSLGPEPYGGTSGVALFLAELAVATGDGEVRRAALGAIRQALERAEAIESPLRFGLFGGQAGLAYVAARVGTLLGSDDVVSGARNLLATMPSEGDGNHEHDLLNGTAGGVVALLQLARLLDDDSLTVVATTLGKRLVTAAECDEAGCSWPSPAFPEGLNLTGLSHGAAGIGIALLQLWHTTQNEHFLDTAERAFNFERQWFDASERNWPDFRHVEAHGNRLDGPFPYRTFWCHGAPGIALSRLCAWQLTGDARYRDEAVVALETTHRAVLRALHDGNENYSLCHGLSGNAEILLRGRSLLGSEFEHFESAALQAATEGIRLYMPQMREWPCGTHGGWTPGLMTGMAGIGRTYLHLANPGLPCLLLPGLS